MSCAEPGCDEGWIHHQAPHKPLGVTMCSSPCPKCNADEAKPLPQNVWVSTTHRLEFEQEAGDEDGPSVPKIPEEN